MNVDFYMQLLLFVVGLTITFLISFVLNRILAKWVEKHVAKTRNFLPTALYLESWLSQPLFYWEPLLQFSVFPGLENLVSSLIITAGFHIRSHRISRATKPFKPDSWFLSFDQ
jgi:hypothetical protein